MSLERTHYAYTIRSGGVVLYVGCTNDPRRRLGEHRHYWLRSYADATVELEGPLARCDAERRERDLIALLRPVRNRQRGRQRPRQRRPRRPAAYASFLHLRLTRSDREWLKATAQRRGLSVSAVLRGLIETAHAAYQDPETSSQRPGEMPGRSSLSTARSSLSTA